MQIAENLIKVFWKFCGVNDLKRLSKQIYPSDLIEDNDIQYVADGDVYHQLDVYYPKNSKGKLPVIIDIHGGGWFYGDKELNKNYCLHLAQRGFVVFNISYRLAPDVSVKEQLQDCMDALTCIGKAMKKYPCNKNRVFMTGDSAGGQLAAFAAAANSSERLRKIYGASKPDLKIKALALTSPVPFLTPTGLMKMYMPHILGKDYENQEFASYIDFDKVVDACDDFPPTIFFTSVADVVAEIQTVKAYRYLKSKGIKTKLSFSPKPLQHVYQVLYPDDKDSVKAMEQMVKFFKKNA